MNQPIAVVISFIDCIHRRDLEGLVDLISDDHRLVVFDEAPVEGKSANAVAWRGYMTAFDRYVIHPRRMAERGDEVAILGSTTGSHLGLPDEQELERLLIWVARVERDRLSSWTLVEDTPEHRARHGLDRV